MLRQCCFATAEAERKGHVYCLNRCMEQQGLEIFNMTRTRVTLNRIHPNALRYCAARVHDMARLARYSVH